MTGSDTRAYRIYIRYPPDGGLLSSSLLGMLILHSEDLGLATCAVREGAVKDDL